jgi:hypothetical protein
MRYLHPWIINPSFMQVFENGFLEKLSFILENYAR